MVPNGWEIKTLEDVVSKTRKITYGIVVPGPNTPSGNLMIRAQDYSFGWNGIDTIYRVSDKVHESYKRSQVKEGDVLLTIVGSIGKTAIVPKWLEGANLTQQTARLCFEDHDGGFFHSVMSSSIGKREVYRFAKSGVQPSLNLSDIAKFEVPVPPLTEQQKIATILGTWDKAISTTERLIDNSKQQKKALLQQLLTGKKRLPDDSGKPFVGNFKRLNLRDLTSIDKRSLGKKTPSNFEFSYISLSDVETGKIAKKLVRHNYASSPSRARRVVHDGDILLATVRPNLKGFAKAKKEHDGMIASTGFSVLTPKPDVSGEYLYHYLFSCHITGQLNALVVGSNYPAINSSDVSGLKVYAPSYEEQVKIARILTNNDQSLTQLEQQLANLKQEKKALMQQLLTGQRRVTVN